MTYVLWILQALLAAMFVFAGGMKLITPAEMLAAQAPLPELLMRFVGLAELLGGLGLILPSVLRRHTRLTALAAAELAQVMLAATVLTLAMGGEAILAAIPLIVGVLLAFVAYGRWRIAPQAARV